MHPKILLVDDNTDLLQITAIILKGQGYLTVSATTLADAAQKIRIHQPPLILLDVNVCDENGMDFCRLLKNEKATSDIRIILMSGDELKKSCCPEADDFLAKPFDVGLLIDKVQQ